MSSDEEKIERIRKLAQRIARDREELQGLIPEVFPEKRGEQAVRGRLNEVAAATGWTRDYVARIRDGRQ